MDGQRFDALAKALASASSRRAILKGLVGGALALTTRRHVTRANNGPCADFCVQIYPPGPERGACVEAAAHGDGLCPACGGDQSGVCYDAAGQPYCPDRQTDPLNCGGCGIMCGPDRFCCGGACIPICTALDQCHDVGACDPNIQVCTDPAKPDATGCDDGDPCTYGDVCTAGHCAGTPVDCPPDSPCVTYACNGTDSCTATFHEGAICDDEDLCTQTDTCQAGICVGENPVQCPSPRACEEAGTCDPATGSCVYPHKPAGTVCRPSAGPCDAEEVCDGVSPDCPPDGFAPAGTPCEDGDVCNGSESCDGSGTCQPGTPLECDDGNPCTIDTCDPIDGCQHTSVDDGTFCPVGRCQGGVCEPDPLFGGGQDGDLVVGSGQTVFTDDVRSALSASAPAGQAAVPVVTTNGFAPGQELLVIQMQGAGVGTYEFGTIASVGGGTLTLEQNLMNSYAVGGNSRAQAVRVPHYRNLTVQGGGLLTVRAWDGSTGGGLALRSNGTARVETGGALSVAGKGFRGGTGRVNNPNQPAFQGEGENGQGGQSRSANGMGGGGGQGGQGGGLGGTVFDPDPTLATGLALGGGGGGASSNPTDPNPQVTHGAQGGGLIYLAAANLQVVGVVQADGQRGNSVPTGSGGGGGGGAGGSILIKAGSATIGAASVTVAGGAGGQGLFGGDGGGGGGHATAGGNGNAGTPSSGGAGGVGRIQIES